MRKGFCLPPIPVFVLKGSVIGPLLLIHSPIQNYRFNEFTNVNHIAT